MQTGVSLSVFVVLIVALVVVHSLGKPQHLDATSEQSAWGETSSSELRKPSGDSLQLSSSEGSGSGNTAGEDNSEILSGDSIPILGESETLMFYDEIDEIADGALESDSLSRARLLEIVSIESAPTDAKLFALELALDLAADEDFGEFSQLLADSEQPTEILEMVYFDLHGRGQSTVLRNLLPVALNPQHPFATESRETIEFLTDAEIDGNPTDLAQLIEAHIAEEERAFEVIDSGKNVPVDRSEAPVQIPIR